MSDTYNLSDLGNARRLADLFGNGLRYCERLGGWYVWDGKRWARDERRAVELRAKEIPADILLEASKASDSGNRTQLATHALKTESEARLRAMINLAASEPGIMAVPADFDRNPWRFNVNNGTLDLRTGDLRPHDPGDLITKLAPVDFDPEADAPLFREFMAEILSADIAAYLQRAVGLSMIGVVLEHLLLFLHGNGANGKTTLLRALQAMFGDYARQADPELLLVRRGDAHPTGVADLLGARLVVTTEVSDGRRMAEALVKQLTGGDKVKARFMHRDFFEFDPSWTIWLAANHKPVVRGTDDGIWRRVRLVPFDVTVPKEDQDPELVAKLADELPGILNWALAGALEYQRSGLHEPVPVLAATNAYRAENDVVGAFLETETEGGTGQWVEASVLYERYKEWCKQAGEYAVSQRRFGQAMTERGFERGKHPDKDVRRVIYRGVDVVVKAREPFPPTYSHEAEKVQKTWREGVLSLHPRGEA